MSDLDASDLPTGPRLHAYTSMWRLRGDAWASLADVTKRMSDTLTLEEQRLALRHEASELVRLLEPLESYWAFPGRGHLEQIAALCDLGDYESAMQMADTVTRVISGNPAETDPGAVRPSRSWSSTTCPRRTSPTFASRCGGCDGTRTRSPTSCSWCRASRTRWSQCC